MKILVVEDSRLARVELKQQLSTISNIQLLGECENIDQAQSAIEQEFPDVLLLDINMPGGSGFELLEKLEKVPLVIFTTAYSEYAVKSFEYDALDYLLKPITESRLTHALEKAKLRLEEMEKQDSSLNNDSQFFVKDGDKFWFIKLRQVQLFESVGNYTKVYFEEGSPLIYKALGKIEQRLPEHFFRANRSQIINIHSIKNIESSVGGAIVITLISEQEVELSRRQSSLFKSKWGL